MSLRVCPIASVHAPIRRVWSLLSQPVNYARWWDATAESIQPKGHAQPGQRIHAHAFEFGIRWNLDVLVENVDESRHALDIMTTFPLGVIIFNHITCTELDSWNCQVSFG